MKKQLLTLAAALLLVCGNITAQEPQVLISDSFEEYTVGNHIATEAVAAGHSWWTVWNGSSAIGGNTDGIVSEAYQSDGDNSAHLTYGNDQVLLLGDEKNGIYDIEFDILVPQGKNGYFNILHKFAGSNSVWAMQCYLHLSNDGENSTSNPGHGTIHAGSNSTADVPCVYDEWMHFRLHVDTDHDIAQYYYTAPGEEEVMVCEWQWSLDSFGKNVVGRELAAINFYPPENTATSEYYVDNIVYTKTSGETAPSINFSITEMEESLPINEIDIVDFTISNEGTSIADYVAFIDFGEGEESAQTQILGYYNNELENISVVSYNTDNDSIIVEAGAMFPASFYGGAVMGTRITKASIFIGTAVDTGDTIPLMEGQPLVFRIYGPGLNGQPGDMIAEKILPYDQIVIDEYNEVTFDEPIPVRGFNFWTTVEMVQKKGMYPLAFDASADPNENSAYVRLNGAVNFSPINTSTSTHGNIILDVTCQGDPVKAWAVFNKNEGSILIDETDIMLVTISSVGLQANTTYNADMVFVTNDPENEEVAIPLTLHVGDDGVIEPVKAVTSLYPNPTNGNFHIKGENLDRAAIYNTVGQLVKEVSLKNGVNNIELNVESGVYFVSIFDNNGNNNVERLVIK